MRSVIRFAGVLALAACSAAPQEVPAASGNLLISVSGTPVAEVDLQLQLAFLIAGTDEPFVVVRFSCAVEQAVRDRLLREAWAAGAPEAFVWVCAPIGERDAEFTVMPARGTSQCEFGELSWSNQYHYAVGRYAHHYMRVQPQ